MIQTPGDPNYGNGPNGSQMTSPTNQPPPPFGHPAGGGSQPPKGSSAVVSIFLDFYLLKMLFPKEFLHEKSDCVPFEL